MRIAASAARAFAGAAIIVGLFASNAPAVSVTFQYADSSGEGFYDPTLGAQRRAAWEYAVNMWASRLEGSRPLKISAAFNDLGSGDYAILGKAGANYIYRDFPGAAQRSTWYGDPLADQMANFDLSPGEPDIIAQFNSQVDTLNAVGPWTFYYGTDENAPPYKLSFVRLAMHELTHGLGFSSSIKATTGLMPDNLPNAYDRNLVLDANTKTPVWNMSTSQRLAAVQSNNLFFNGANLVRAYGRPAPLYSPNPGYNGSSISHFNYQSFTPAEMMEPILMGTSLNVGLADEVLNDIGWTLKPLPLVSFDGRRLTGDEDYVALWAKANVTVSLSSAAIMDTQVAFVVDETGGAVAGEDYVIETPSPVVIPAGTKKADIQVRSLGNSAPGAPRSITLNLTSPLGAELGEELTRTIYFGAGASSVDNWGMYF